MMRSSAIRPVRHLCESLSIASCAASFHSISRPSASSAPSLPSSSSRRATLFHGVTRSTTGSDAATSMSSSSSPGLSLRRGYSTFASGYSALTRKTLDSILKLESAKDASPEDLTTIWNEYHIGRGHISAVMGSQLFDVLQQRASSCPLFVIPVRRGLGYITLLLQAQMPFLLFTGLDDYRARGSDATPFLTVTHYTEFSETKGLVLVRGDVVLTSKLSDKEARAALEAAHSFYLSTSRYKLVTTFNKDSRDFEFRDVLRELNISA